MPSSPAVYVVDAVRTPIGKAGGALARVRPDDLAAVVLRALLSRTGSLDPTRVDEVFLGAANQAGEDNRNVARMAGLLAGLPPSVPGTTVNRLCASGLDAVISATRAINGAIAVGHPLGCSGARLAGAVAHRLAACGGGLGVASLCVGVGQGVAVPFER